jgi:tyrosine-protein kinase
VNAVLAGASVSSAPDADVLEFGATSGDPALAARIATEYARQFTIYHQQLDTGSIKKALNDLRLRVNQLRAQGDSRSRVQAGQLQTKADQLQTLLSLETSNAVLVRRAVDGAKIRPRPFRYGVLGLGLGLVLGIGLAFLRDAFDTRLRSSDEIGTVLGMPLLARLPEPPKQLQRDNKLVMIAEPTGGGAEAFRRLRMNLEFASIGRPRQVITITSALEEEGKSTTIANLAVALALAGRQVALVDLDLRRPALAKFFRLDARQPGLSAVVLGHVSLEDALAHVPLDAVTRSSMGKYIGSRSAQTDSPVGGNGNGAAAAGSLVVLPTGIVPPDPGEFVGLEAVSQVIAALRERADVILIDAPPLLPVGDALTIGGFSDALIVAVRADLARRPVTGELAGILSRMPSARLGFVLCGAQRHETHGYYGYGYHGYSGRRHDPAERRAEEPVG